MKKFLILCICLITILITSCDSSTTKTLPDLTGKSRAQIAEILEKEKISYVFKFSDEIITSNLDLDLFVSYNGSLKAGDEIDANYQVYVYTTVIPLTYKISDNVTMDFEYKGKRIVVGLCGDLWFDENVVEIKSLSPDLVFWPVYTDYNYNEWNKSMKYEYAEQAGKIDGIVLYINSFCKDKDGDEIARGGSTLFVDGQIVKEIPAGNEDVLVVEV